MSTDQQCDRPSWQSDNFGVLQHSESQCRCSLPPWTTQGRNETNGTNISFQYHLFGRIEQITYPDSSTLTLSYNQLGTPGKQNMQGTFSSGMFNQTYFDGRGRAIRSTRSAPDNKQLNVDISYDAAGKIVSVLGPYFQLYNVGSSTYGGSSIDYDYDEMGRLLSVTTSDGRSSRMCYDGIVMTRLDPTGHRERVTYNILGLPAKMVTLSLYLPNRSSSVH
jgi:YD repeat-containing protein